MAESPKPPPWWDIVLTKVGGLAVLIVGLSGEIRNGEANVYLVATGLLLLGGREALTAVRSQKGHGGSDG